VMAGPLPSNRDCEQNELEDDIPERLNDQGAYVESYGTAIP
jgi:hypothetical protein